MQDWRAQTNWECARLGRLEDPYKGPAAATLVREWVWDVYAFWKRMCNCLGLDFTSLIEMTETIQHITFNLQTSLLPWEMPLHWWYTNSIFDEHGISVYSGWLGAAWCVVGNRAWWAASDSGCCKSSANYITAPRPITQHGSILCQRRPQQTTI